MDNALYAVMSWVINGMNFLTHDGIALALIAIFAISAAIEVAWGQNSVRTQRREACGDWDVDLMPRFESVIDRAGFRRCQILAIVAGVVEGLIVEVRFGDNMVPFLDQFLGEADPAWTILFSLPMAILLIVAVIAGVLLLIGYASAASTRDRKNRERLERFETRRSERAARQAAEAEAEAEAARRIRLMRAEHEGYPQFVEFPPEPEFLANRD